MSFAPHPQGDRRGGVAVILALSLTGILGMAALAVDLSMLFKARGEAQRAADAAALAGASAYLDCLSPFPAADTAKRRAARIAAHNQVGTIPIDTNEVDDAPLLYTGAELTVQVIPDSFKVRTWVTRDSVPLLFAPILNVSLGSVGARAAAEAAEAGEIECLKPWAIPDENYTEASMGVLDTLKIPTDAMMSPDYDPVDSWFFAIKLDTTNMPPKTSCTAPKGDQPHQGTEQRWGAPAPRPNPSSSPDNACAGAIFGQGGESCWYRSYICNEWCGASGLTEPYPVIKGNMVGPTAQGVNALLLESPDVHWDPIDKRLENTNGQEIKPEDTARAIKVGLYNPATYTHPDQYSIRLTGFAYFFLESGPHTYKGRTGLYDPDQAESITGRFLYYAQGSGGGPSTTPFTRVLTLVE